MGYCNLVQNNHILSSRCWAKHFLNIFIFIYLFGCTRSQLPPVGSSSLTKDRTQAPCIGSALLATGPPGKSPEPSTSQGSRLCKEHCQRSHCTHQEPEDQTKEVTAPRCRAQVQNQVCLSAQAMFLAKPPSDTPISPEPGDVGATGS